MQLLVIVVLEVVSDGLKQRGKYRLITKDEGGEARGGVGFKSDRSEEVETIAVLPFQGRVERRCCQDGRPPSIQITPLLHYHEILLIDIISINITNIMDLVITVFKNGD